MDFNQWNKVNESSLRNELVRSAGKGDIHGMPDANKQGFDQKTAFDNLDDNTEFMDLYDELSKYPEFLNIFIRKISRHASMDSIKSAMQSTLDIARKN
jgi:hypothetical protein